jgi:uncharacterized protein (DUF305 family)
VFRKALLVLIFMTPLAGCGLVGVTDANHSEHGMLDENNSAYSSNDLMFAQMMIPHHQQAIEMSTLAATRASNSQIKEFAAKIKAEQAPEITQMQGWLEAADQTEMGMHGMEMGMLSDEEMSALEKASGKEFDLLFLTGMIKHHQSAVQMADSILTSSNEEVRNLAKSIVSTQKLEIVLMKQIQTTLN